VFASRSHARALAACLPRPDHVYITTDELFRFHNNRFDEMSRNLNSTVNTHFNEENNFPKSLAPNLFGYQWIN